MEKSGGLETGRVIMQGAMVVVVRQDEEENKRWGEKGEREGKEDENQQYFIEEE